MNAADRRRLTPTLGIVCALLALLLIALWAGAGRGARWNDSAEPARLPPLKAAPPPPSVPPLQDFANVWEHPLFSPDRKPIPGSADDGESADSNNLELTGVIILPDLRMALLRERSTGRTWRVREGQSAGGATVIEVKPRSAVVEAGSSRSELALKPGAAPATDAEDNAAAGGPTPFEQTQGDQGGNAVAQPVAAPPAPGQSAAAQARARMLKARIEQRRKQAEARARLQRQQQNDGQQQPQQQE
jgi:general secretion pathway protein N